jgi:hypothetical protein
VRIDDPSERILVELLDAVFQHDSLGDGPELLRSISGTKSVQEPGG